MNKMLKGYLAGLITAVFLVNVLYAASTVTLKNVRLGGITVVVDGQKINPVDAKGKTVEALLYNGTTYLPVRAVADAFKKPVYWDGPNYTVYLGENNGTLQYPTDYLKDLASITDRPEIRNGVTDNYGNVYDHAFGKGWSYEGTYRYLTDMKYSRFKTTLFVPQGMTANGEGLLQVIADGKTIYSSPKLNKASRAVDIDVDITGYNDIEIKIVKKGEIFLYLGNAGFYQ